MSQHQVCVHVRQTWRCTQQSADSVLSLLAERLLAALDGRLQVGMLNLLKPLATSIDDVQCGVHDEFQICKNSAGALHAMHCALADCWAPCMPDMILQRGLPPQACALKTSVLQIE